MKCLSEVTIVVVIGFCARMAAAVTFDADTLLDVGNTDYEGQDVVVSNCTLTVNGPHLFHSLLLTNSATLTHSAAPGGEPGHVLHLTIPGDMIVSPDSRVDVSTKGYGGQTNSYTASVPSSPGGGSGRLGVSIYAGAGAGYGGIGGVGGTVNAGISIANTEGVNGPAYGSITAPLAVGSGGGKGDPGGAGGVGGAGGGAMALEVGGMFRVDGCLLADGGDGQVGTVYGGGGGGSGGGICLQVGSLRGAGLIESNGGNGRPSTNAYVFWVGGGGGGGRIAIYYGSSDFTGLCHAYAGIGAFRGGAGTICLKQTAELAPRVLVDAGNIDGDQTPISGETQLLSLAVIGGAKVSSADLTTVLGDVAATNSPATFSALTSVGGSLTAVGTNASLAIDSASLTIGRDLTFAATNSSLTVSGASLMIGRDLTFAATNSTLTVSGASLAVGRDLTFAATNSTLTVNGTSLAVGRDLTAAGSNTLMAFSCTNLVVERNIAILSGAALGATAPQTNAWYLSAGGDMRIDVDSQLDLSGMGYGANLGPGAGSSYYYGWFNYAVSGAGYGGIGLSDQTLPGGSSYGSITSPTDPGSGGGGVSFWEYNIEHVYPGGAGGGALQLVVLGGLQIDGRLSANGESGTGGGGSGGGLLLQAGSLAGGGIIQANGGWKGGGGRIAIYYTDSSFLGSVQAYGGGGAGAGTIYYRASSEACGHVIVDGGRSAAGALTPIQGFPQLASLTLVSGANASVADLTSLLGDLFISNSVAVFPAGIAVDGNMAAIDSSMTWPGQVNVGGNLLFSGSGLLNLNGSNTVGGNVSLLNGVTLSHTAGQTNGLSLIVGGNMTVDATSVADVSGRGCASDTGFGIGDCPWSRRSGAGYGGRGGGNDSVAGGKAYGSMTDPVDSGSGGGGGAAGGGVLRLIVTGDLRLDGSLLANGRNGICGAWSTQQGGAAGGSINLRVHALSGEGAIQADGGNGSDPRVGGGGGGRIAVYYAAGSFIKSVHAYGGTGFERGGAGTVYIRNLSEESPHVLVDNGSATLGASTPVSGAGQALTVVVRDGANASVADLTSVAGDVVVTNGFASFAKPLAISGSLTVAGAGTVAEINFANTVGRDVNLLSGGVLTHSAGQTNGLTLSVAGNMTVDANSRADVSGRGCASDTGFGVGDAPWSRRAGAGYGGRGGGNDSVAGGKAYGSMTDPVDSGSGGGGGAAGGGVLRLIVTGDLRLDGDLLANGRNGICGAYSAQQGGAAGGSINLRVHALSGAGTIQADGGNGSDPSVGGGSGGRIAIYYAAGPFIKSVHAYGGAGFERGGAGTVCIRGLSGDNPQLWLDNGSPKLGASTPVSGVGQLDALIIRDGITATFADLTTVGGDVLVTNSVASFALPLAISGSLTVAGTGTVAELNFANTVGQNVNVLAGGMLTHSVGQTNGLILSVAGDMTVDANSRADVSGRGCAAENGIGVGARSSGCSYSRLAGAGYGGCGGRNNDGAAGGKAYGSMADPVDSGSGGGLDAGGGGVLRLTVNGELCVDGSLQANGQTGGFWYYGYQHEGGSAGGSISLRVGTLSGVGTIQADGGNGTDTDVGGGGGGRIAIYYAAGPFIKSVHAYGGTGFERGGAGTVYIRKLSEDNPQVLLDNGSATLGASTPVSGVGQLDALIIRDGITATFADLTTVGGDVLVTNSVASFALPLAISGSLTVAGAGTVAELNFANTVGQNVNVLAGGMLTHSVGQTNGLILSVAGDMTVDANSRADVSGRGCAAENGFGVGARSSGCSYSRLAGAGYGGCGGRNNDGAAGGKAYGSMADPVDSGSGGGLYAAGGGVLRLTVNGELCVDGSLQANGQTGGFWYYGYQHEGGSAGGSISLRVGTLSGVGTIQADGGNGTDTDVGGGGGGRIAICYAAGPFIKSVHAYGGTGFERGGAGTVYIRKLSEDNPQVLLDNGSATLGASTPVSGAEQLEALVIRDGITASFADLTNVVGDVVVTNSVASFARPLIVGGNVYVQAGGVLTHGACQTNGLVLNVAGDMIVDALGTVDVSGKGYAAGTGPGVGGWYYSRAGAGYGGTGGGHNSAAGGLPYGSTTDPTDAGSGGGGGAAGGGVLRLTIGGELRIAGDLRANGQYGNYDGNGHEGGASGGSINLRVNTLSGTGNILANGGNGSSATVGDGGGGRIAVYYADGTAYSGQMQAYGGNNTAAGGMGTVYLKNSEEGDASLILDNGGTASSSATSISGLEQVVNLVVRDGANASFTDLTNVVGSVLVTNGAIRFAAPLNIGGSLNVIAATAELNFLNTVGQNVNVLNGGVLTHSAGQTNGLTLRVAGDMTVDALSRADVSGKGYATGFGPGKGGHYYNWAGAGYGGVGGDKYGAAGGLTYGSLTDPTDSGSGGGGGAAGGGALRLIVNGVLQVDGTLAANGMNGIYDGYSQGGASGGSINLRANSLSGTGLIQADGGNGSDSSMPGGGGGRIALYVRSMPFTEVGGTMQVTGGSAGGGAGTLYTGSVGPRLNPISNRTIHAGITFSCVADAISLATPAAALTFALQTAPASMAINPDTGLITWTTSEALANTTNFVTVVVSDDNSPSLSDTQSFRVIVVPRPMLTGMQVITVETLTNNPAQTPQDATVVTRYPQITWTSIPGERYRLRHNETLSDATPWHTNLFDNGAVTLDWMQAPSTNAAVLGPFIEQSIPAWGIETGSTSTARFFRIEALP